MPLFDGHGCAAGCGSYTLQTVDSDGFAIDPATPIFASIIGGFSALGPTESDFWIIFNAPRKLSGLLIRLVFTDGSAGNTVTFRLRINEMSALETVTITKLVTGPEVLIAEDVIDVDQILKGDVVDFLITGTNGDVGSRTQHFQSCITAA